MPITSSVALTCSACGRTFQKPRSTLQGHNMVACPHCAALQTARPAAQSAPLGGTVRPTYRKDP